MISDVAIRPPMGRPPLNRDSPTKRTLVRLEQGIVDRIDALVPANRRAQFIRQAVEEKLERDEREKG